MSNEYRIRMFDPQGYETTTEAVAAYEEWAREQNRLAEENKRP